jgi:hypothetical protein
MELYIDMPQTTFGQTPDIEADLQQLKNATYRVNPVTGNIIGFKNGSA